MSTSSVASGYRQIYFAEATAIRHSRLDDLGRERERLKDVLTTPQKKGLEQDLRRIEAQKKLGETRDNQQQVMATIERGFEMKNLCDKTHFVFAHAQAAGGIVITYLLKKLAKKIEPHQDLRLFNYLREFDFTSDYTVDSIAKLGNRFVDMTLNKELLCVDALLLNTSQNESSIDFLSRNVSMQGDRFDQIRRIELIVEKYGIPKELRTSKAEALYRLIEDVQEKSRSGNYYVICIPKDKTNEIAFRAHPGGSYCNCLEKEKATEVLERLNQGIYIESDECSEDTETGVCRDFPQYRLLTSGIKPENGILVFPITSFERQFRKEIKQNIQKILESGNA